MKEKQQTSTKPFEPDKVDAYMQKLTHPLAEMVEALRQIIWARTKRSAKK